MHFDQRKALGRILQTLIDVSQCVSHFLIVCPAVYFYWSFENLYREMILNALLMRFFQYGLSTCIGDGMLSLFSFNFINELNEVKLYLFLSYHILSYLILSFEVNVDFISWNYHFKQINWWESIYDECNDEQFFFYILMPLFRITWWKDSID